MKKIILFLLLITPFSYGLDFNEILSNTNISSNTITEKFEQNNIDKTKILHWIKTIENTDDSLVSINEYILLAMAYETGVPKYNIPKNENKALYFYKKAYKKGNSQAGIRASLILIKKKKFLEASDILSELYFKDKNLSLDERKMILRMLVLSLIQEDKDNLATFFLKILADKFHDENAAIGLAFKYYNESNGEENDFRMKEANKYLNIACKSHKKNKQLENLCHSDSIRYEK